MKGNTMPDIPDDRQRQSFGPQSAEVAALVRRAANLTGDEANNLYAARRAAWSAAWSAARYAAGLAAWSAAGSAAEYAAWSAAGYAAEYAAGLAARSAASALAIRHLIGQYGFTQAHYDTLTGPWRRVIGQVHPDDGGE